MKEFLARQRRLMAALFFAGGALLGADPLLAQESKGALRIVIGVPPGGSADLSARLVAERLREILKRPVIVENKPGANMLIATKFVVASPADGDVLLYATAGPVAANPILFPRDQVDPLKDLTPLTLMFSVPLVVAVGPKLPVASLAEFIAAAKEKPGALNYSFGTTTFRVAAESLIEQTGIKLTPVPYNGAAPSMRAVLGGEVEMTILDVSTLLPNLKSGKLKGLVVSAPQRSRLLPDVPAATEVGVPAFDIDSYGALFAPAGMSAPLVAQFEEAVSKMRENAELRDKMLSIGMEPVFSSSRQLIDKISRDSATYRRVMQNAKISQ